MRIVVGSLSRSKRQGGHHGGASERIAIGIGHGQLGAGLPQGAMDVAQGDVAKSRGMDHRGELSSNRAARVTELAVWGWEPLATQAQTHQPAVELTSITQANDYLLVEKTALG